MGGGTQRGQRNPVAKDAAPTVDDHFLFGEMSKTYSGTTKLEERFPARRHSQPKRRDSSID
jgi:hypothetical protein